MKVLITSGPTWVKLDEVRIISNQSTGEMGRLIAKVFEENGAKVTLIEGPVREAYKTKRVKILKYSFFEELTKTLKQECRKQYDVVIHAAAVSDFKPASFFKGKISSKSAVNLKLIPTEKIINLIKKLSPKTILIGFKLEPNISINNIKRITKSLFQESHCDLVVANSINKGYTGFIIDSDGKILARASNKNRITKALAKILRPQGSE